MFPHARLQSVLHSAIVHWPVPWQSSAQSFPGQFSVHEPAFVQDAVHPPCGQLSVQVPSPVQLKSQPWPVQVCVHVPISLHSQTCPGAHSELATPIPQPPPKSDVPQPKATRAVVMRSRVNLGMVILLANGW